MAEKRFEYRYATEEELEELKHREFAGWMLTYVSALNKLKYHLSHIYTNSHLLILIGVCWFGQR